MNTATTAIGDDETLYSLLGVSKTASAPEIKKAYRKLALQHHPDRQATDEDREKASDIFPKLSAAYEILVDDEQRKEYDEKLSKGDKGKKKATPSNTWTKPMSNQNKAPPVKAPMKSPTPPARKPVPAKTTANPARTARSPIPTQKKTPAAKNMASPASRNCPKQGAATTTSKAPNKKKPAATAVSKKKTSPAPKPGASKSDPTTTPFAWKRSPKTDTQTKQQAKKPTPNPSDTTAPFAWQRSASSKKATAPKPQQTKAADSKKKKDGTETQRRFKFHDPFEVFNKSLQEDFFKDGNKANNTKKETKMKNRAQSGKSNTRKVLHDDGRIETITTTIVKLPNGEEERSVKRSFDSPMKPSAKKQPGAGAAPKKQPAKTPPKKHAPKDGTPKKKGPVASPAKKPKAAVSKKPAAPAKQEEDKEKSGWFGRFRKS